MLVESAGARTFSNGAPSLIGQTLVLLATDRGLDVFFDLVVAYETVVGNLSQLELNDRLLKGVARVFSFC